MSKEAITPSTLSIMPAAARAQAFADWLDNKALPQLRAEAATHSEDAGGSLALDFCGHHIEAWLDKDEDGLGLYFVGIHACEALGLHDVKAASALSAVGTLGPAPTLLLGLDADSPDVLAGEFGEYADLELVDEPALRALVLLAATQNQAAFVVPGSNRPH
uniref:Uncharacterized protein n=1 Tax=mine drainage metagenome TaxID=410659 RepID=E6QPE8_9ZZZZ